MLRFDTEEELFLMSRNSIKIINITLKITLLKKKMKYNTKIHGKHIPYTSGNLRINIMKQKRQNCELQL